MTIDFTAIKDSPRMLIEARLRPVQGERFQPTGFSDLGPAQYQLHDGTEMLLLESAQSVANRMEAVCWDEKAGDLVPELVGLPYVKVVRSSDASPLTSSVLEAHRFNSPYIIPGLTQELNKELSGLQDGNGPVDIRRFAHCMLKYDLGSVLHGVWISSGDFAGGRLRLKRLISGFIEARNVRSVVSGGAKNDHVDPSGKAFASSGGSEEGFGNIPFSRLEFTAETITAFFNLDISSLLRYNFDPAVTDLLIALSLYKIRRFLIEGLRLRTACDLMLDGDPVVTCPQEYTIRKYNDILATVKTRIRDCTRLGLFANPAVTQIKFDTTEKSSKSKTKAS